MRLLPGTDDVSASTVAFVYPLLISASRSCLLDASVSEES